MWRYDLQVREELGECRTAMVDSLVPLYIAGALGSPTLEISEDATWGPQLRIRLHAGQVDPRTGRKVEATIDDGDTHEVAASHPEGRDDVLSLREPRALAEAIAAGRMLYLRVRVRHQGWVKMTFDVAGLDRGRLKVAPAPL